MLLNALGRIRIRHNAADKSPEKSIGLAVAIDTTTGGYGSDEKAVKNSISSSLNSSPTSRSVKRYSNNLFTSGRLRDYTYLKNVDPSKSSSSSTRTISLTPTEKKMSTSSLLSSTPERSTPTQPGPNATSNTVADEDEFLQIDNNIEAGSDAEYQLENQLGPIKLKRASMALQQVMKEIEDELEEEILLPRTTPIPRGNLDQTMQDAVRL